MKWQKYHKLKFISEEKKKTKSFILEGIIGLKTLKHCFLTKNQIESTRKVINKYLKGNCKIWIKLNNSIPTTKKTISSRMGKGIGKINNYIYIVKKGMVIFELLYSTLISKNLIKTVLIIASRKLPISTSIYYKKINGI